MRVSQNTAKTTDECIQEMEDTSSIYCYIYYSYYRNSPILCKVALIFFDSPCVGITRETKLSRSIYL
jgi:hypothetical protein